MIDFSSLKSVRDYKEKAKEALPQDIYDYLTGGADDMKTLERNYSGFDQFQLRPRRLVDVSSVDTTVDILGEQWSSPIALAPVGLQGYFHKEGEMATARAAQSIGSQMVVSTVSSFSYGEVASRFNRKPWFQLYPTTDREVTKMLIHKAEDQGCSVLVLTVDVPVLGNRQMHRKHLAEAVKYQTMRLGNLDGFMGNADLTDPSLTWDIIAWLRDHSNMKIVVKGILTHEDAGLCLEHGVDGLIVSNHGGRQLESGLSTIEALGEVTEAIDGKIPVMLDGGIQRGTDVLKALALGAKAVFIGRAFCYGLAVGGEAGVGAIIQLLQEELLRNMMLMGCRNISEIDSSRIQRRPF